MEVVSKRLLTGRYCAGVEGLMEITAGDKLTRVIEDISSFGIGMIKN